MEKEHESLLEEVAGKPCVGTPMTEEQAYYLHEYIDPEVDRLIANMELEKKRRNESDEYLKRTYNQLS